jgi:regulation of enolase protein 1 (concanavalin A-like superfamily)
MDPRHTFQIRLSQRHQVFSVVVRQSQEKQMLLLVVILPVQTQMFL